jgi:2-octaprenyl-6-methoxyphenol hydroxylase
MTNVQQFDIIISGAGLSGLLTAIGLLNEAPELSIAMVEPFDGQSQLQPVPNFDDRCLALSYGSLQLLQHWQIWQQLKPSSWPIKTIVTSDRGHVGKTIMRAKDYGLNAMGYVAAMRNMGQAFEHTLSNLQQKVANAITWFRPDAIEKIEQTSDYASVTLGSGKTLVSKLLVIAEGGNSPSRQLLNIQTEQEQYAQTAVISNVKVSGNQGLEKTLTRDNKDTLQPNIAFERFTTSGPIAFLPIGDNEYSVVWSVEPDQVEDILALSEGEYCAQLQTAFGSSVGTILSSSKQQAYPLALIKANSMVHNRVALVGNAGHTVHPIAGQGFNLGLRDIAVLVDNIKQSVKNQQDIGSFERLNQYQAARALDISRITGFTDLLVRSFALKGRLAAGVRTIGLMTLQKCNGLQQWLAMHFMSSKKFAKSK